MQTHTQIYDAQVDKYVFKRVHVYVFLCVYVCVYVYVYAASTTHTRTAHTPDRALTECVCVQFNCKAMCT